MESGSKKELPCNFDIKYDHSDQTKPFSTSKLQTLISCTQARDIYIGINALWPHEEVFSWMRTHLLGLFWPSLRSSCFSVPSKSIAVAISVDHMAGLFLVRDEETGQSAQTSLTHVSFTQSHFSTLWSSISLQAKV